MLEHGGTMSSARPTLERVVARLGELLDAVLALAAVREPAPARVNRGTFHLGRISRSSPVSRWHGSAARLPPRRQLPWGLPFGVV